MMIEPVEKILYKHKASQFVCDNLNCNYTTCSSNSDIFQVNDIKFCPSCGWEQGAAIYKDKETMTLRAMACKAMEDVDSNYNEAEQEIFFKGVVAFENVLENAMRTEKREINIDGSDTTRLKKSGLL